MSEGCTHDCSTCSSKCSEKDLRVPCGQFSNVKRVIGVVSGKGGVGKSLVTSLLASAMQARGHATAIMDADVTGPSIPKSFGLHGNAVGDERGLLPMESKTGIKIMSVNLLLEKEDAPVVWRGPVIAGVIQQFWSEVVWGDVDYMFVDMPPGTGDVPLTVFQSIPVDGIIIGMSRMAPDFETFDPLPGIGTVIVTMYAHPRVTTVDSDHYGCSLLLMDHLFELGHEQIRYIGGPSFSVDEQFRRAGWQDALERKHIEPAEPLEGDWSANSGYEAGRYLAEHDRTMTAIYAANDQMANGAIAALRDSGLRVPEDVSVVGVDDSLDDFVAHNELTTVRFDLHQRGREVFEHAVPKAGATDKTVAIRIPGQLIVRHTTAAPRT